MSTDPHAFTDLGAPTYEDPVDDGAAAPTQLEDVVAALTSPPAGDTAEATGVRLEVVGRPGVIATFSDNITGPQLETWRRQAQHRGNVDPVKFAGLICAHTSTGLEHHGRQVIDPDTGEPATLRSPWLHRLYQAPGTIETARRLFGRDGHLNAAAEEILAASGWGSEAVRVDPT